MLSDVQAKLVAAQNCHPNAVQALIAEALDALDDSVRAEAAVKAEREGQAAHQAVIDYRAAFNGDIPMPTPDEIKASVQSLEVSRSSEWGQASAAWASTPPAAPVPEQVSALVECYRCQGTGDSASGRTPCGECDGAGIVQEPIRPQASAAVPEGYVLVPVEPTLEMIAALGWSGDEVLAMGHAHISSEVVAAYKAMLAASQPEVRNAD